MFEKQKQQVKPGSAQRWQKAARMYLWQWRFALVALGAGLAAIGVLQALAPPAPAQASVVFAARALPVGTVLTEADLKPTSLPAQFAGGMVTDPAAVLGQVTITGVSANGPIWESAVSGTDLAGVAPEGTAVVPLRLDAVTTSVLVPGDLVDLVAVGTDGAVLVASRALVLPARLGEAASSGGMFASPATPVPVTLVAVTQGEASQVASAAHQGQVTAILIPRG